MIVDTSAVLAVLLREAGFERCHEAILTAAHPRLSAASVYEGGVVMLTRKGVNGLESLAEYLTHMEIVVESFTNADAKLAIEAYRQFGKGFSPVGLNLGDCAVYALARLHDEPVLATSDEFVRAGLRPA